jgi:RNA polymerase sigma-70 factor (ECF subfamily)
LTSIKAAPGAPVSLSELTACNSRAGKGKVMTVDVCCALGADRSELVALIPHMRAFARSLCHDRTQADDLAQEALASAWRHRGAFTPGTNLKAWVFRIVRNQFYSDRRRSWRVCPLDPDTAAETLVAVSDPNAALQLDDVRRAMLKLSDEQREALTLIGVTGLSYEEVAAICGCSQGTIKSRVSRARRRLLAILSDGALTGRTRVPDGVMASMIVDAERLRAGAASRAVIAQAGRPQPSEAYAAHVHH